MFESTTQMIFKPSCIFPASTYPPHQNLASVDDPFVYSSADNGCPGGRSVIADVFDSESGPYSPSLNWDVPVFRDASEIVV